MREQIEKYLGTVQQSTAKTIAGRIGLDQLEVSKELHRMLGDGIVEREKRNGNEYMYWLSRAGATTQDVSQARPKSLIEALVKAADAAKPEVAFEAVADPGLQARVASLEQQAAALQLQLANEVRAHELTRSEADARTRAATSLQREYEALTATAAKLRENNSALERRIDELTLGPVGSKAPLFVTVGRYAAPKRHASLDKAQKRAASLVRNEKESEVLVLEPVGRVVRGSEWRPL